MFVDVEIYSVRCMYVILWICLTHYIYIIMAIINSLAIGKSVKSAGNLTYKTVRGRTIASQRITTNRSNTLSQQIQRSSFSASNQAMQLVLPWINSCFEKSKYGSSRNAFLKECKSYKMGGLFGEVREGIVPLFEGFLLGLATSPTGEQLEDTIAYTSMGSAPIVVNASYFMDSYTPSEGSPVHFRGCTSITYIYTSPVTEEKAEFLLVGFFKNGAANMNNVPLSVRSFNLTDEDISAIAGLGLTVTKTVEDGVVTSITCTIAESPSTSVQDSIFIAIPRISGKVPTTRGVFRVVSEPAP